MPNPRQPALFVVARVLFAVPFVLFGLSHFAGMRGMAPMVPLPGGAFWVGFTGLCMILAGVSLLVNRVVWLSMVLLATLMVVYSVVLHVPEAMDAATRMQGVIAILKNTALAGGALAFAVWYPPGHLQGRR